jgi:hypothetical protein
MDLKVVRLSSISTGSQQSQNEDYYEHSWEPSVSIEGKEFLGLVNDYKLHWDSSPHNGQVSV